MKPLLTLLLSTLLGLMAALPLLGGDEPCGAGGGGGDNGIWILPRSGSVNPAGPQITPRATFPIANISHDFRMQASGYSGGLVAGFSMGSLGTCGIAVTGSQITVPASLMVQAHAARVPFITVLVLDDSCQGYLINVVFDANNGATAYAY